MKLRGVYKRKDGRFECKFTIEGKRRSAMGHTAKEAYDKAEQMKQDIINGLYKTNKNITLDEYFKEYIEKKAVSVKPATVHNYQYNYDCHISDKIGSRKIKDIEKREVQALIKDIATNKTEKTANSILRILTGIFNEAVCDEIILKSPCLGIKKYRTTGQQASETIHRAMTKEEQEKFMQYAKTDYYYELFAFMLCTGVRAGEAGALTWKDIDYKNNVIHITSTVSKDRDGKRIKGDPKSKTSKRDIPMNDNIKAVLRAQKEKTDKVRCGVIDIENRVFITQYRNNIITDRINTVIERIIEQINKAGFKMDIITSHAFRDTFATRYIEAGGTPQTLKTILGHSSLAMTMDLYAHVLPNTKQEEMNNIVIAI